jgi:hypothetical protein
VAWLLPELEEGAEPELRPLEEEFDEELELPVEPELPDEPELPVEPELPDEPELPVEPVLEELEGVEVCEVVLCVDPGKPRATAPAATTLARPTAVVVERTLALPRSRSATARRILSRFMGSILGSGDRSPLWASSQLAMSRLAPVSRAKATRRR